LTSVKEIVEEAQEYLLEPPQPLRRIPEPPEPYPMSALGEVLQPAAQVLNEVIRSPEAIAAQSVLAAATLATQPHANLLIDGRRIPLSEYFISVGESGVRKSATDQAALAPVTKRQRELLKAYSEQRLDADIEFALWKKEREGGLRQKDKGRRKQDLEALGPPPPAPVFPMLTTEEPTYEGLVKLLDGGWPSVGLFSDEGGRFLGGYAMSEEQRMKTMAGLNSMWDGRPITRTRGGDGNTILYGRRVSLNLLLQPLVAGTLLNDLMAHDQGLLSRCLVSAPISTLGQQKYVETDHTADPRYQRYVARLSSILERELPWELDVHGRRTGGVIPRDIEITTDAKGIWISFHDWIQGHLSEHGILRPISGISAKAAEHALRMAGVLALIDDIETELVSRRHIDAGIELARFYLTEALRLFDSSQIDPDLLLAEKLLGWLGRRATTNSESSGNSASGLVYLVLIYQYGPNAVWDKATAKRIVGILEEHGWMQKIKDGAVVDGKHRREAWDVHPALWGKI